MAKKGAVVINTETCKGCQLCIPACPFEVLDLSGKANGKGYYYPHMAQPEKCAGCTNCSTICPDAVITVYRL